MIPLDLRIIEAMRAWDANGPISVRAVAAALGEKVAPVTVEVRRMRYRGVIHLDRLALTPNYLSSPADDAAPSRDVSGGGSGDGRAATPPPVADEVKASDGLGAVGRGCTMAAAIAHGSPPPKKPLQGVRSDSPSCPEPDSATEGAAGVPESPVKAGAAASVAPAPTISIPGDVAPSSAKVAQHVDAGDAEPVRAVKPQSVPSGEGGRIEPSPDVAAPTLADEVRAEAEAKGRNRAAARSTGTVVARKGAVAVPDASPIDGDRGGLSVGGFIQLVGLNDGPGAGVAMLREAWPGAMQLLGRVAVRTGERPIPLIVRLIHDEAARQGMRVMDAERETNFGKVEVRRG